MDGLEPGGVDEGAEAVGVGGEAVVHGCLGAEEVDVGGFPAGVRRGGGWVGRPGGR